MTAGTSTGGARGPWATRTPGLHVFISTMAEYIKTAPLLRLLDARGIEYRLIDAGQHGGRLGAETRERLGVREPDLRLGDGRDLTTAGQVVVWGLRLAARLGDRRWVREHVFAGRPGICVVHGDTPSTLLSTLLAHRAGLTVAHLETGLRSGNLLNPMPEEAVRIAVMRLADLLFAPDASAVANLRRMKVRGEVVPLPANTVVEALVADLGDVDVGQGATDPSGQVPDRTRTGPPDGPVVATLHRVENLHRAWRLELFRDTLLRIAADRPVVFPMHGPTIAVLGDNGMQDQLRDGGVRLMPLTSHREFLAMVVRAPYVITDGGSIQEEGALLGVPTLLWRRVSERPDGIGRNVVVSGYDPQVIDNFLVDPAHHAVAPADLGLRPSQVILDRLLVAMGTTP